jgi:plastocyanin
MIRSMWIKQITVGLAAALSAGAALADDGTIKGKISFEGTLPKPRKVNVDVDAHCKKEHPQGIELQTIKVKNGGLADAFIQIKSGLPKDKKWDAPKEPVVLSQKGCEYHPHIVGVMAGQGVKVVNDDPTQHNIHGLPKINSQFNFSQSQKGMEKLVELNKPEDFNIKCDVHNWMGAHAFVMSHPFFATSDEEGNFEIKNVPPGTYDIEIWHETLAPKGKLQKGVKVEAGKTLELNETLGKKAAPVAPKKK